MRPPLLPDADLDAALRTLDGWHRAGTAITRTVEFPGFPDAIAFVTRLAFAAEALDHHPDLDIRYAKVTVTLSTHSAGGVTALDVQLATTVNALVP
ncbi:MAG: 4a-hydroxytetrahydrobiopterin dehydratase [Gemmatimonadaceae bacterium]|nr:4a-hydroxytetrahydrobiopterin dehydratase [Gemmatimonadaceae bacterium]